MANSETAWKVSIAWEALPEAKGTKAKLARGRGARAAINVAGYRDDFVCAKREDALSAAKEITEASGVPMSVSEVARIWWPA